MEQGDDKINRRDDMAQTNGTGWIREARERHKLFPAVVVTAS